MNPVTSRPMRPCKKCRKATANANGYCDAHQEFFKPAEKHRRFDACRESPAKRGYDVAWIKCRNSYLALHPLCELCEEQGAISVATEVHHKKPISEGGERLDHDNLQALCKSCHSSITGKWRGKREKG